MHDREHRRRPPDRLGRRVQQLPRPVRPVRHADGQPRPSSRSLPSTCYALSKSDGADPTLAAQYGSDPARNGEPFGELGLVDQQDAAWGDQHGEPRDPQPGNEPGTATSTRDRRTCCRSAPAPTSRPTLDPPVAGPVILDPLIRFRSLAFGLFGTTATRRTLHSFNGGAGATVSYTISDGTHVTRAGTIGATGTHSLRRPLELQDGSYGQRHRDGRLRQHRDVRDRDADQGHGAAGRADRSRYAGGWTDEQRSRPAAPAIVQLEPIGAQSQFYVDGARRPRSVKRSADGSTR